MFQIDIVTLFAFFGTFQGLIFAAVFWLKNKTIANKIFSILLLATSIRIAKNIFVHLRQLNPDLFSNYELWRMLVYTGISHQLAIGPLFFFYFRSKLNSKFSWQNRMLWHFLPYVSFVIVSLVANWSFWQNGGLWTCYISILLYYLLALREFKLRESSVDRGTRSWLSGLLLIVSLLMLAYSPILFHYVGYAGGGLLYMVAILYTGYLMIANKRKISFFRTKYESSSLRHKQIHQIKSHLETSMLTDRPYLQVDLTLQKLAELISVQPHHLSRVINQELQMNFADYINSFRLEEATRRLKDSQYDHLKIAALAYECGFNSVPTFNTLFKKTHQMTPSNYRKAYRKSLKK